MKFSAHIELSGVMVLEPMTLNEPVSAGVVVGGAVVGLIVVGVVVVALLQPVRVKTATSASARGKIHFFNDLNNLFSFIIYFNCVLMLLLRGTLP
jgi:hypothetical protein